jgi:hypothetical protein
MACLVDDNLAQHRLAATSRSRDGADPGSTQDKLVAPPIIRCDECGGIRPPASVISARNAVAHRCGRGPIQGYCSARRRVRDACQAQCSLSPGWLFRHILLIKLLQQGYRYSLFLHWVQVRLERGRNGRPAAQLRPAPRSPVAPPAPIGVQNGETLTAAG